MQTYLRHYETPHPNGKHPRHYIGKAVDVVKRNRIHDAGKGASFTAEMVRRGIGATIARVWPTDRERQAKAYKAARLLCPVCSGPAAYSRLPE